MEWAIDVAKESGLPVAATLCLDKIGDVNHVPTGECAVRMVKAGYYYLLKQHI
jgi:betaine-homocysteine S-methyltransferase